MRWIDRLSTAQRVVIVVALGLALGSVAGYLTGMGTGTGWHAYAPLSGQLFQPRGIGEPGWLRLIIWLAAISLWALLSLDPCANPLARPLRSDCPVHQPIGGRSASCLYWPAGRVPVHRDGLVSIVWQTPANDVEQAAHQPVRIAAACLKLDFQRLFFCVGA